jgi:hypothetical protein
MIKANPTYKDLKIRYYLKLGMAVFSLIASVVIGFIAIFIPPHGVIDSSVLWFTAQLLVFTSTLLGLSMNIDNLTKKLNR